MAGSTCIKGSGWIKKLDAWKTIKDWGLPKHPVPPMGVITLTGYKPVENFSHNVNWKKHHLFSKLWIFWYMIRKQVPLKSFLDLL